MTEEWSVLNDLSNNDSIKITKPVKGNGIVIVIKMKQLISNETKFKKLKQNSQSPERTAC